MVKTNIPKKILSLFLTFILSNGTDLPKELIYRDGDIEYTAKIEENYQKRNPLLYISIVIFFVGAIYVYFIIKKPKIEKWDVKTKGCQICGKKEWDGEKLRCKSWKTPSRICNEGPFCSLDCLKKHTTLINHEYVLGIGKKPEENKDKD